jgi:hypothetical protein
VRARRLLLALAVAVVALAVPASAAAISRAEAERVALNVLAPESLQGDVILFGLPKPLAAGTAVNEYLTGARLSKSGPGKAWLFWLDLEPGAYFEHASRVLLVSDRTGRVLTNRRLGTFPLLDGRAPAFLRSDGAYWGDRYHVYSNTIAETSRAARSPTGVPLPTVLPPGSMAGECILLVVHTPAHPGDRKNGQGAIDGWGDLGFAVGVPVFVATAAGPVEATIPGVPPPAFEDQVGPSALARNVRVLVEEESCHDVVVYVQGHGTPAEGLLDDSGQPVDGGPAAITTGVEPLSDAERERGAKPRRKWLAPKGLETIAQQYADRATFKFVLMSCYAGRFKAALADEPNVKIVAVSSAEDEPSHGALPERLSGWPTAAVRNPGRPEFTHGLLTGIEATLGNQAEIDALAGLGDSLMARLIKAGFDREDVNDRAARKGRTHPEEMNSLSQPYAFGEISHQHREGAKTIICGTVTGPAGAIIQLRLRHVLTGNTATSPLLEIGANGRLGWGFTLSEYGGFSVEVLVGGVPLATTRYTVPDPPAQGPFACAPG